MTPERIADIRASAQIVLRNGVYQETAKHQAKLTLECLDEIERLLELIAAVKVDLYLAELNDVSNWLGFAIERLETAAPE